MPACLNGQRILNAHLYSPKQQRCTVQVHADSYRNIALSIGADAAQLVFATDVAAEAVAAKAAGWQAILVKRPGNKPLEPGHGCPVVESLVGLIST